MTTKYSNTLTFKHFLKALNSWKICCSCIRQTRKTDPTHIIVWTFCLTFGTAVNSNTILSWYVWQSYGNVWGDVTDTVLPINIQTLSNIRSGEESRHDIWCLIRKKGWDRPCSCQHQDNILGACCCSGSWFETLMQNVIVWILSDGTVRRG